VATTRHSQILRITQELFSQILHIYSSRPQTHEQGPDGNGDQPLPAFRDFSAVP